MRNKLSALAAPLIVSILVIGTVIFSAGGFALPPKETDAPPDVSGTPLPSGEPSFPPLPDNLADSAVMLKVKDEDNVIEMTAAEYIIGALGGEMPAAFNAEALSAQAVAVRTYAYYTKHVSGKHRDGGADVCTDSSCCQAYKSKDELREKWGNKFAEYSYKLQTAVSQTDGIIMEFEGKPIFAAFFSSAYLATESCRDVWTGDLPYLVSVDTPETAEAVSNFITETIVTTDVFKEYILVNYPEAKLGNDHSDWLSDVEFSENKRLRTLKAGGVSVSGTAIRKIFSLSSTAMEIEVTESGFLFRTYGKGHGVGMSQWGANLMAGQGKAWREILTHYYTGIEFNVPGEPFAGNPQEA
ncbi:MAG: stage II sporulation protein D [Oscillospiraceae bacterium]|jgi:stage II sporulation protein D|nr:stage II sporulation protein D [Oscillospiraceae bacterium]